MRRAEGSQDGDKIVTISEEIIFFLNFSFSPIWMKETKLRKLTERKFGARKRKK
jgi:hypothetical protein